MAFDVTYTFVMRLNYVCRGLKVPCPLIANMNLYMNTSNFLKGQIIDIMTFSIAHWDTSYDSFVFSYARGIYDRAC